MVITSNGHPITLLTAVDESSLDKALGAWKQVRATQAITEIQKISMQSGKDKISMAEIEAEIGVARKQRRKRSE